MLDNIYNVLLPLYKEQELLEFYAQEVRQEVSDRAARVLETREEMERIKNERENQTESSVRIYLMDKLVDLRRNEKHFASTVETSTLRLQSAEYFLDKVNTKIAGLERMVASCFTVTQLERILALKKNV